MKLAEALRERADLILKIEQLKARIAENCLVQEDEQPIEDPTTLLTELDQSVERLEMLISSINLTNSQTRIDGETLTDLIARKDCMKIRIGVYQNAANSARQLNHRVRGSEIKMTPAMDVKELQREIDRQSHHLRLLDNRIQATNWDTDLVIRK